ncbi:hypothetical protein IAD21_03544 [Abditibacteriota bacterium]|nr:hypothetical protein IAD21_03544 [Abditibacteriota bacterium]
MRKAKSLLGLSVITHNDGKNLGTVRDLIFSDNSQKLLALLLSDRELFGMIDATCVPWNQVREIGSDALMVESDASQQKVHADALIAESYDARQTIDGKQITTDQGEKVGYVSDMYLDDSGYVTAFEVSGGLFADALGGKRYLAMPSTLRVGQDVIIVPHDAVHQLELQSQTDPGGLKGVVASATDKVTGAYDTVKDKAAETYENVASASVDKQREFVIGKTAGHDVIIPAASATMATPEAVTTDMVETSPLVQLDVPVPGEVEIQKVTPASATDISSSGEIVEGEVLVRQGETITAEHADRAIAAGILGQLVTAVAKDSASSAWGSASTTATSALGNVQSNTSEYGEQAGGTLENAALGKPSAREVVAPDGSVLVAPGQTITQPILDRADLYGKKGEVIAAAGMGATSVAAQDAYTQAKDAAGNAWQTVKETVAGLTGSAQDKKAEYDAGAQEKKIKNAVGRPVTRVILAKDDSVILNTGDIITNKAVEAAREADVLDILLDSVYDQTPDITPEMLRVHGKGDAALETQIEPTDEQVPTTVTTNPS